MYFTRNRKKKQGKLVGFKVALCVVLLKEKVPVTQVVSKGTTSSVSIEPKKRKAPGVFLYPARKLCILLHSPLETTVKKPRGMAEEI